VPETTALNQLREAGFLLEREETFLGLQHLLIRKQSQP
jgi:hypothetical protein